MTPEEKRWVAARANLAGPRYAAIRKAIEEGDWAKYEQLVATLNDEELADLIHLQQNKAA